jgi:hypothetical protein
VTFSDEKLKTIRANDMIEQVEQFFYYEDDLTDKISEWARDHCDSFVDQDSHLSEHPQQHMILFQEYCGIFERMLTGFLQINDINSIDFYTVIKREHESAAVGRFTSAQSSLASSLLAATDFHGFCDMMHDVQKGQDVVFCPPLVAMNDDNEDMGGDEFSAADSKKDYDDEDDEMSYKSSYKENDDMMSYK